MPFFSCVLYIKNILVIVILVTFYPTSVVALQIARTQIPTHPLRPEVAKSYFINVPKICIQFEAYHSVENCKELTDASYESSCPDSLGMEADVP